MRTGIICICKNEDNYIDEWVNYHLALGFDKIIIAENDDVKRLTFDNPKVVVEDFSRIESVQRKAYTALFEKYKKEFDWLLFIDCDEFLVLDGYATVADFLEGFDCEIIRISEKHFTDNDELDVIDGNYNVFDRFKTPANVPSLDTYCKSFINTKVELNGRLVRGHSIYDETMDVVNALGEPCEADRRTKKIVFERCWINHYPTKTIGEYIKQKYKRGGPNKNPHRYANWQNYFFRTNKKTDEKIEYAKKLINELSN